MEYSIYSCILSFCQEDKDVLLQLQAYLASLCWKNLNEGGLGESVPPDDNGRRRLT